MQPEPASLQELQERLLGSRRLEPPVPVLPQGSQAQQAELLLLVWPERSLPEQESQAPCCPLPLRAPGRQ